MGKELGSSPKEPGLGPEEEYKLDIKPRSVIIEA
jgi:hypothetical protein